MRQFSATIATLFASAWLCSCSTQTGDVADVFTPSQVNANPKLYEGRKISVKGWIILRAENRNIWDSKSDSKHLPDVSHCLALMGVDDWTADEDIDGKILTISGVYHEYPSGNDIELGMCSNSNLRVDTSKEPFRRK